MSNKSQLEYRRRVNRVIDHITRHRAEDLSLETLAEVAAFSPYHFHRVFKSVTGENLNQFVARLRLEMAASSLLTKPHADVLGIALDNGFNSASAFARAFKDCFGMSATEWRATAGHAWSQKLSNLSQAYRNTGQATDRASGHIAPEHPNQEVTMKVEIKNLPDYHVAYMRHIGPYGPGIAELWKRFALWGAARGAWSPERNTLGISYDDPRVTEPAKCRYDAALVVPQGFAADAQVGTMTVKGGAFAVVQFRGNSPAIGKAWDDFFQNWLPASGFQPDDRLCFELYHGNAEMDPQTGSFACELCMPVKPL